MGIGLETLFHLVYEMVHWTIAWVIPKYSFIEAAEMGVKITGKRVKELSPGGFWSHRKRSAVYVDNVKRKVREPADVTATTSDGISVRVGISLAFIIINIKTWLVENEDAEQGLLLDCQRAVLKFVRARSFSEIQRQPEEELTKFAQRELGRYFGVQVKQLGITTFVETDCRDLNHSGMIPMTGTSEEEEDE